MNRSILKMAFIALAASMVGCSPDFYRNDADRQVQRIIREEQKRTIGYTPQVEVAVTESPSARRKAYEKVPTTALPALLTDVITTQKTQIEIEAEQRRRRLGPSEQVEAAGASALKAYSAVDRVRTRIREPYRLGPPAEVATAKRFGLFESLAYAVENSRNYQSEMESLYADALNVTLQRHLFTPRPFANVRTGFSGGQGAVDYRAAYTVTGEAGIRQRLPYGGEIVASGLVDFVNAISDNAQNGEDAQLALTASIPLLRGAGMVNLEALIQSERNVVYAVRDFETYRRNFVIQVSSAYFQLVTQQQAVRNRYVRYRNAVELTNRTEALFDAGRINALEVQRAQTDLLDSEDRVNNALQSYENALDRFKLTLGMPVSDELEVVSVQVDVPTPQLDFELGAALARQFRLDLQTQRDRLDDARRRVEVAKNNLLPDLDFNAAARIGNAPDDPARKIDGDELTYNAGLRLDLPIDRVDERNRYRSALISLEAAKRSVLQLEDQVAVDIRASVRTIRSAFVSLDIQQKGIEIARQRLEFANESLLTGRTTDSRNVVEAQTALLSAQDSYDQAKANVQVAILSYLRDTGVLRLDPASGELGIAMQRDGGGEATTRPIDEMQ